MKNLTFPSEITFYQLEDETVLSITNSGSRSLMLNFTFDEIVAVSNHPRNILLAIYPATGQTKEGSVKQQTIVYASQQCAGEGSCRTNRPLYHC